MSTDPSAAAAGSAPAQSPQTRLQASREAMRTAMLPAPAAAPKPGQPLVDKLGAIPPVGRLLSHPAVATARETVEQWWLTHPWRPFVTVGAEAAKQAVVPLARRHPGRLLGAAMVAGAVLSRWRPWKWILASAVPALAASMLPTLLTRVATRVPLSALLRIVGASVRRRDADVPARAAPVTTTSSTTTVR